MDVPDRMAPQTSGLCGTEAREAPQPRGEADPSPTICSRSDTHSGLLQAFFFCLRSQRHLLAPWPARALGSFCAPLNPRRPHPDNILGHPWGRRSSPARPVCPVSPPVSPQA